MKLEISELINNVGQQARVNIDQPCPPDADLECAAPITGTLTLTNTGHHLLVRGDLETTLRTDCARCLTQVLVPTSVHVEEEFPLPRVDARGVPHWELEDEPVGTILENYSLDVGEMARQHFATAAPTAPLCKEECQGLCPSCGKNLNEGACACAPEEVDERMGPLKALLERFGEDEEEEEK
jgi:uncharacterized protein